MSKKRIVGIIILALLLIFNIALIIYKVAVYAISLAVLNLVFLLAAIFYRSENDNDDNMM